MFVTLRTVHQCDAEYIVECMQIHLQQETIAHRTNLWLEDDGISDAAIDIFHGFLCETPCHLHCIHSTCGAYHHDKPVVYWKLYKAIDPSKSSAFPDFKAMNALSGLPTCVDTGWTVSSQSAVDQQSISSQSAFSQQLVSTQQSICS
jgi:hypothetical protein